MADALVGMEVLAAPRTAAIAHITLRRPEKKNAMTPGMLDQLLALIDETNARGARAIVLSGVPGAAGGGAFCSGFDLRLCHEDETVLPALLRGLSRAIVALRRSPLPVVIGAHGVAIAGGAALFGGADVVAASSDLKIGYPVLRLGVSPAVSAPFLGQSVGGGRSRERLLGGELIGAADALRDGLVHEVVCDDADGTKTIARALQIASEIAAKPGAAVGLTKELLNEHDGTLDGGAVERALAASLSIAGSPERLDRLSAFLARKPS